MALQPQAGSVFLRCSVSPAEARSVPLTALASQHPSKPEELVALRRLLPDTGAAGSARPARRRPRRAGRAHRKQMPRKIAVQPDERKTVHRAIVRRSPTPIPAAHLRSPDRARTVRTSADRSAAREPCPQARSDWRLVGAGKHHPVIFHPAKEVRRDGAVAKGGRPAAELPADRCRQRFGDDRVAVLRPKVTA